MAGDDIKNLLRKNLEVSEKSLNILQKMHRAQTTGRIFAILKWVVIIGISVGLFYYLEPYLKSLMNTLNTVINGINEVKAVGDKIPQIPDISNVDLKNLIH